MINKYIVERTDGTTNRVEAEICECVNGVIRFYDIVDQKTKIISIYPFQSVVCVTPYEEGEESSNEEPERQENTNDDLISRSELLNYISTHWTEDIKSVIKDFPKARFVN